MSKARGGIYLIRANKPGALLGLSMKTNAVLVFVSVLTLHFAGHWPWKASLLGLLGLLLSGRHNAYVGMTNSYYHRERQHFFGSSAWGSSPKPFSDLKPRFYKILPLGEFLTSEQLIGRRMMKAIETLCIALLLPVYNTAQQAPWNVRRISARKADAQRIMRMKHPMSYKIGRTSIRYGLALIIFGGIGWGLWR